MTERFETTIQLEGKTATFFEVPLDVPEHDRPVRRPLPPPAQPSESRGSGRAAGDD
jgi:hypothetical protein